MKNCKYNAQLKVHQVFQLNMLKQRPLENIIGFLKLIDGFGRLKQPKTVGVPFIDVCKDKSLSSFENFGDPRMHFVP